MADPARSREGWRRCGLRRFVARHTRVCLSLPKGSERDTRSGVSAILRGVSDTRDTRARGRSGRAVTNPAGGREAPSGGGLDSIGGLDAVGTRENGAESAVFRIVRADADNQPEKASVMSRTRGYGPDAANARVTPLRTSTPAVQRRLTTANDRAPSPNRCRVSSPPPRVPKRARTARRTAIAAQGNAGNDTQSRPSGAASSVALMTGPTIAAAEAASARPRLSGTRGALSGGVTAPCLALVSRGRNQAGVDSVPPAKEGRAGGRNPYAVGHKDEDKLGDSPRHVEQSCVMQLLNGERRASR